MTRAGDTLRRPTVLMCDLVCSSAMAESIGEEALWEVLLAYQDLCSEVVHRYDGNIYKRLGDGLLVLYGVPRAHEDDPRRAVHTALGIVEAVRSLSDRVREDYATELAVRVGIHTGEVVAGQVGGSMEIAGAAIHQTDRLQTAADVNGIVVSAVTAALLGDEFELEDRGERDLRGFTEPMATFAVLGARVGTGEPGATTEMVGRSSERSAVHALWNRVQGPPPAPATLLIRGEAGIGKSRLARFARDHASRSGGTPLVAECSPYHQDVPFHAIGRMLASRLAMAAKPSQTELVERLTAEANTAGLDPDVAVPVLAELLSVPLQGRAGQPSRPAKRADEIMQVIGAWWSGLAEVEPRAIVIEDLHRADPSTLQLIDRLVQDGPPQGVLLVLTTRPGPDWDPGSPGLETITLEPLEVDESMALLRGLGPGTAIASDVIERSGGNPLFLQELAAVTDAQRSVPGTLHDLLLARLDQAGDLEMAQLLSVTGVAFDERLAEAASGFESVGGRLDALTDGGILRLYNDHRGRRWRFAHELLRDVAYESLPTRARRVVHSRLGDALLTDTSGLGRLSQAAMHLDRAERHAEAADVYARAADASTNRGGFTEALHHLDRALEIVEPLPEQERRDLERMLRLRRAFVLVAREGFGSEAAREESARALDLSPADALVKTAGARLVTFAGATIGGQRDMAAQLIESLESDLDDAPEPERALVEPEIVCCRGLHEFGLGHFSRARQSFERTNDLFFAPPRLGAPWDEWPMPTSVVVAATSQLVPVYWVQGAWSAALAAADRAIAASADLDPPMGAFNHAYALSYVGWLHQLHGNPTRAREVFLEMETTSKEFGFVMWEALARAHGAVASAHLEPTSEWTAMLSDLRQTALESAGSSFQPYLMVAEADIRLQQEEYRAALDLLDAALQLSDATTELLFLAETHRSRAHALQGLGEDPREDLERAWQTAVGQDAHVFALRAALDMSRLDADARPVDLPGRIDRALEALEDPEAYPESSAARAILAAR